MIAVYVWVQSKLGYSFWSANGVSQSHGYILQSTVQE